MIATIISIIVVLGLVGYLYYVRNKKKLIIKPIELTEYVYIPEEIFLLDLINDYKEDKTLPKLTLVNHLSNKAREHNQYMIDTGDISHANFESRSQNIIQVFECKSVGEVIAYNYSTPNSALNRWFKSEKHKRELDKDYTHCGISISKDILNKNYYTVIFMKY